MISEFLNSSIGIIIISILWGLGLATLFKHSCSDGMCKIIVYKGPSQSETSGVWNYGGEQCYKLQSYVVDCKSDL